MRRYRILGFDCDHRITALNIEILSHKREPRKDKIENINRLKSSLIKEYGGEEI